jgi:hypothetical protein
MFFLTEVDPNARVKGTRDPLGLQGVWRRFARQTIVGITSQTSSLNDFRILVLGSWLIDQLDEDTVPHASAFVCWEQLAAYARLHTRDEGGFRGVTRARSRLARQEPIPISANRAAQILANQAGYGIWGLYRSTAWATGLLAEQPPYVNRPDVDHLVRLVYRPRLEKVWGQGPKDLLNLITHGGEIRPWTVGDRKRLEAIAECIIDHPTQAELDLYRTFLLDAGPDDFGTDSEAVRRRQRTLYRMLADRDIPGGIQRRDLQHVAATTGSDDLAEVLEDILAGAALFAAASRIFSYISQQAGSTLQAEVGYLGHHFATVPRLISPANLERLRSLTALKPRLLQAPGDKPDEDGRWLRIAQTLHDKHLEALLRLVVDQNEAVSQAKGGGAGWVSVADSGTIKVQIVDHGTALDGWSTLDDLWIAPFYVANLLTLARALKAA